MFECCRDEGLAHFVDVAAVCHAYGQTKPHPFITVMPVPHRRVDKLRVRHDHSDVVARQNNGAACADLLHSTYDARHFHAVPDRDRSLRQNDQTADEITGDVLQAETDAYANCACKNRQRSQMNTRVLQDNENANHEDDVAENLGNGVLERTVESTVGKKSIKKKMLGPR